MKVCGKCSEKLPIGNYAWKNKSKGKRQSWCKACHKKYSKRDYYAKTDYYVAKAARNNAQYRKRNKTFILNYLRDNP